MKKETKLEIVKDPETKFDKDLQTVVAQQEETEAEKKFEMMADLVFDNFLDEDFMLLLEDVAKNFAEDKECEETLSKELKEFAHNVSVINALCLRNRLSHDQDQVCDGCKGKLEEKV